MKKLLSLILAVCMLMSAVYAFPVNTAAADPTSGTCGSNLTWSYNTATATLTISGTGEMTSYGDSKNNNGKYTTTAPWRPYYNTMKTVIIGDGVTSIGDYAFYGCTSLTSVTIPDSVTSIGGHAFYDCTSLTSVTIPDSVTSIGDYAFRYCTNLTSVTIGNSVTSIGNFAFEDCTSLTSVTIGDSVTSIGYEAFYYCTSLTSVTIGNSVTSIGYEAFYNCRSLTSVTIGNSVTSIGSEAFYNCTRLTSVTIGNSVTSIDDYAFYRCTSLTDVYYKGTREQWNSISIGSYNDNLKNAHLHIWCEEYGHILDEIIETVPATCTVEGYKTEYCTVCKETVTEILPLHSATVNRMEIPATCTRDGMFTEVCTECGTTVSAGTIPATGHTEVTETVNSTCTVDGYTKVYCSVCNTIISNTVIPKLGHSWNSGVITVPATCTGDGVRTYSCTRSGCTESWTEPVEKLGHNYKSTVTAPTCTADGYTTHTCSRCTDTYTDNIVTKLGHVPVCTEIYATEAESGMYFTQCSRCNAFLGSGVIPAGHKHEFDGDYCISCGVYKHTGDLNGDGKVNASDMAILKKVIVGKVVNSDYADVNGDGKVTASDVVLLKKIIVGKA